MTKLKCDKAWNVTTQVVTNSNCDTIKIVRKLKLGQTQLWQNSEEDQTQIETQLKLWPLKVWQNQLWQT